MNAGAVALLVIAGGFAVADWVAVARGQTNLEYACKPATLAALIGVALLLDPTVPGRRAWFVVALAFSLAGDVFLMLPQDLFVAGLASFLVGHLAYVAGFTRDGGSAGAIAVAAVIAVIVGAGLGTRILGAVRSTSPEFLAPVAVYMLVISAMVSVAAATGIGLAIAGAVLFYVSDASIAWDRFVRPWSWARTWIMVTYHLGQACLVLSLTR